MTPGLPVARHAVFRAASTASEPLSPRIVLDEGHGRRAASASRNSTLATGGVDVSHSVDQPLRLAPDPRNDPGMTVTGKRNSERAGKVQVGVPLGVTDPASRGVRPEGGRTLQEGHVAGLHP